MKAIKITGMAIGGLALFAGAIALVSWILTLLWNWLMPELFGIPAINLWQAAGIFILSKLLFTPGFGSDKGRSKKKNKRHEWKMKFKTRMKQHMPHSAQDSEEK